MSTALESAIKRLCPDYLEFWKTICRMETPSHSKPALDALVDYLERFAKEKGYTVTRQVFAEAGDFLRIDLPGDDRPAAVLMSHMDTVHEIGAFGSDPVRVEGEYLWGPGVNDCKGGIAMAMLVLEALKESGVAHPPVRVLFTSDEEISGRLSGQAGKDYFFTETKGAAFVLNGEPSAPGKLTVGRKGIANLTLTITGQAAHAGANYFRGASALREASHKLLAMESLSREDGCTFNCGTLTGGTKPNIVPQQCIMEVDVRAFSNEALMDAVEQVKVIAATAYVPGTSCTVTVNSIRPPMEATEKNMALFDRINALAQRHGLAPLTSRCTGGGSDAAYTTLAGIPTVCSAGPVGYDFHTSSERALIPSLESQALLTGWIITEL